MLIEREEKEGEVMNKVAEVFTDRRIDFEITHKKHKTGYDMPNAHYHPYYELGYIVSGERNFFIDHTVYEMKEGSICMIGRNEIHRAMRGGEGGSNGIVCSFSQRYIEPVIEKYGEEKIKKLFSIHILSFSGREKKWVERLLHTMVLSYRHPDEYTEKMQYAFLEMLFIQLFRLMDKGQQESAKLCQTEDDRMQQAAKYISENFWQELTLPQTAAKFDMSPSYFSKKFKSITGFSFKEYLIMRRIKEASGYLIQTNLTITEIALRCGFGDSNYFGDAFKKVKGVSPRDYRKVSGFI